MTRSKAAGNPCWLLVAALALGCAGEPPAEVDTATPAAAPEIRFLDPPTAEGALGPNLALAGGRPFLSWLEETADGHRLLVSRLATDGWTAPVTVAEGDDFFANWADFPAVVEAGDGSLVAHWLAKTGEETYAYSIYLARSKDGGASWRPLGRLNDDETPTEHGFVSYVAEDAGARAFWLDGREMTSGGAMTLRTALVDEGIGAGEMLDARVCECCATDAALTAAGPLVVYRGRSADEVRDIWAVGRSEDGWSPPALVAEDGWVIPGCPVNGPQVAARGERVAVAWFTVADEEPRVLVAFSADGGASFEAPRRVDAAAPFGRVDVALDGAGSAWVVWLAAGASAESAQVRLQRIEADPAAAPASPVRVATTSGSRSSGFPRLLAVGRSLYVAWVEVGGERPRRIRVAEVIP